MCFSIQVDTDLMNISKLLDSEISKKYFQEFKHNFSAFPKEFKTPSEDGVIYPNVHAGIVVLENGKKIIRPMRYRVRPNWSEKEIPSKYNLFNARSDSLLTRKTWSSLIGRNHAVIAFKKFYEWVEVDGKKKLIYFNADSSDYLVAPVLWDSWQGDEFRIDSFAIITSEPNPEILSAGHDRMPIYLKNEAIDEWLNAKTRKAHQWVDFLGQTSKVYGTQVHYNHSFAE